MINNIIHIATDEKFINSAIVQFEKASPFPNEFYIRVKTKEDYNPIHVKFKKNVYFKSKKELLGLAKELTSTSLVVFHSLPSIFFDIVFVLPKNIKTIWMCFGYEVYNDPDYFSTKNLLGAYTKKYYKGPTPTLWGKFLKNLRVKGFKNSKKQQAIKRIDYIGTAFKEEFEAIQKLTKTKKEFFHFWYYPLELIVATEQDVLKDRPNILIGNSASITNNHIEAFKALKKNKLTSNTKIIVPFSYSKDDHSKCVEKVGKEYFGDLILFLKNFMVLSEYNKILESCGLAIFYNKRQQAVGNTIALLWYGAKVFLATENPFYHFLKRKNVIVFNLEEIELETRLTTEEIKYNRKTLNKLLSHQVLEILLRKELKKISID